MHHHANLHVSLARPSSCLPRGEVCAMSRTNPRQYDEHRFKGPQAAHRNDWQILEPGFVGIPQLAGCAGDFHRRRLSLYTTDQVLYTFLVVDDELQHLLTQQPSSNKHHCLYQYSVLQQNSNDTTPAQKSTIQTPSMELDIPRDTGLITDLTSIDGGKTRA